MHGRAGKAISANKKAGPSLGRPLEPLARQLQLLAPQRARAFAPNPLQTRDKGLRDAPPLPNGVCALLKLSIPMRSSPRGSRSSNNFDKVVHA